MDTFSTNTIHDARSRSTQGLDDSVSESVVLLVFATTFPLLGGQRGRDRLGRDARGVGRDSDAGCEFDDVDEARPPDSATVDGALARAGDEAGTVCDVRRKHIAYTLKK